MSGFQAHHLIPQEIAEDLILDFVKWFPDWNVNDPGNYGVRAANNVISAQLDIPLHNGPHKWLNDGIENLLRDPVFLALGVDQQRIHVAGLLNVLKEAEDISGTKTNGFTTFSNQSDPHLLNRLDGKANVDSLLAASNAKLFTWDKIVQMPAYKDIEAINVRLETVIGDDQVERKVLAYDRPTGTGYFAQPSDVPRIPVSSSKVSEKFATDNGYVKGDNGYIYKDGIPVNKSAADALLSKEITINGKVFQIREAVPIKAYLQGIIGDIFKGVSGSVENISKYGGKIGVAGLIITLSASVASAATAQADENYDSKKATEANKALVAEIVASISGELGGFIAGAAFGVLSMGFATIPAYIVASVAADQFGREIGEAFYDGFVDEANSLAEEIVRIYNDILGDAASLADALTNWVSSVFDYMWEQVFGDEGLFGLEGPLFGEGGPLYSIRELYEGEGDLLEGGLWSLDSYDAVMKGTDFDDVLVHNGWGEALGGKGDDVLIGVLPKFYERGQIIFENVPDYRAEKDEFLKLDGGEGEDWVLVLGGDKARTIGGMGRDWIFNTSAGGEIFGDTTDGLVQGDGVNLTWSDYDQLEGKENSDNIWWWHNTTMWDPRKGDVLKFFGYPLVGGTNDLGYFLGGGSLPGLSSGLTLASVLNPIFMDFFFPFFVYSIDQKNGNLYVANLVFSMFGTDGTDWSKLEDGQSTEGVMVFRNFNEPTISFWGASLADIVTDSLSNGNADQLSDMSMIFKRANPALALLALIPGVPGGLNQLAPLVDNIMAMGAAASLLVKSSGWMFGADPLILDLDGDGIETIDIQDADLRFDLDGDGFLEATGWLSGDDGFLVRDLDRDGAVDDITEMFGGPGRSGIGALAAFDLNADGRIDAADAIWSELQVWRDRDGDGQTDAGEMVSLGALGIVSFDLDRTALNVTTPQGTRIEGFAEFLMAGGAVRRMFDAVFEMNDIDTRFGGEAGLAPWLGTSPIGARGFGEVADLAIAMSNDFDLARMVAEAAQTMTLPDMRDMRQKAGEALGQWGMTLDQTRELVAVRLDADGSLLDRAIWQEDATGGWWSMASGADVLDVAGSVIARPTLDDVLAQSGGWRLEQVFSPSTRAAMPVHRDPVAYLVDVVDGRAVILDHAIQNGDGTWRLASGTPVRDAAGVALATPTLADILAQPRTPTREWRSEVLGHNPLAALPVSEIGVYQVDGKVVDYTVLVTDEQGSFHVWARALDQALELQAVQGNAFGYDLRAYAVNFATLDIVESEDDSVYRVEVLTPGQFNFAMELIGAEYNPAMLMATSNRAAGTISYSINDSGSPSLSPDSYVSAIKTMISLMDQVMDQYLIVSRAFALRMAFQGGLSDYFPDIAYDADSDQFYSTGTRELAPVFSAIFADAPDGRIEATLYLQKWHQILSVMYPDYKVRGDANTFAQAVSIDQRFILQMMLPAFQTVGIDLDLKGAMFALGLDQNRLLVVPGGQDSAIGTNGADFIIVGEGQRFYLGGRGIDTYFIGQRFGDVVIEDIDFGDKDEVRFTNATADMVTATRIGQDLVLTVQGQTGSVTIKNHFKGELNDSFGSRTVDTAMVAVIFADGVIWDAFAIAKAVSRPLPTNDVIVGSGSMDVLEGGAGNDVLQGGAGGDIYLFRPGHGKDVIEELNPATRAPGKGGLDFIQFTGDVTAERLHLSRTGESEDLVIRVMAENGSFTGDSVTVIDQFAGMRFNLGAFLGGIDKSLALDYVAPNMIEKILFEDGSWLEYDQITARILETARTDGADIIYGFIDGDTLDGGKGDDLLIGREGGDTYTFGRGDGFDVLRDGDYSVKLFGAPDDSLTFDAGITWGSIDFLREGGSDTLTLRIGETGDKVMLADQEESQPFVGFVNLIETINWGNGTTWSYRDLFQHYVNIARTEGDDTIYGFHTADSITGGAGDDRLEGRGGSDVYVWQIGHGSDIVIDTAGATDRLVLSGVASSDVDILRSATDLILRHRATGETITLQGQYLRANAQGRAVEVISFDDRDVLYTDLNPEDVDRIGTDAAEELRGSQFAEVMDGRGGDDTLIGGSDGDIYRFDAGYGHDQIIDRQERAAWAGRRGQEKEGTDRIEFGLNLSFATAQFARIGDDLVITFTNRPDTLTIRNQFRSINDEVETFVFRDQTLKAADVEQLLAITGGNRGDNALVGSLTNPNSLDGRQGDDTLSGGNAADRYAFGIGYDFDRIVELTDRTNVRDRVVFGEGVTADDLILRRDGSDLLIDLGNGEDVLRIVGGLGATTVEEFSFSDGSLLTIADMRTRLLLGTAGNDQLIGFANINDRLAGGAGSDALEGNSGNDTYVFGHGDGQDSVLDTAGTDRVEFGRGVRRDQVTFEISGKDLVIRLQPGGDSLVILDGADATSNARGIEQFAFDDGTVLTMGDVQLQMFAQRGNGASDIVDGTTINTALPIKPGVGFDAVTLAPASKYVFNRGDGLDRLVMAGTATADGSISIEDYAASDVVVRLASETSTDLILSFPSTGDMIVLAGALGSARFPSITFADGKVWDRAALLQAAVNDMSSDGNDLIQGPANLAFTYEGGRGNDEIFGGTAVDTFRFARGNGRDVIIDAGGYDEILRIAGYTPSEMRVARQDNGRLELVLTFEGSDDEIVLRSSYTWMWSGVNQIHFGDGTVVLVDTLLAQPDVVATAGNDSLTGTNSADTLAGGTGHDTLVGLYGVDTYVYARGDGVDYIDDATGNATLNLNGYAPGEVSLSLQARDWNYPSLVLRMSDGGEIIVRETDTLARIVFSDGTIWNVADFPRLIGLARDESGSVAFGRNFYWGTDTLFGGSGDDLLVGDWGNDIYVIGRDGGHDRIVDGYGSVNVRLEGRTAAEVIFFSNPADPKALGLRFANGDTVELAGVLNTSQQVNFVFDDQTLTMANARAALAAAQDAASGADTLTFHAGDGAYEIHRSDDTRGDVLVLHGYTAADLTVERHPLHDTALRLGFAGSDDRIDWRSIDLGFRLPAGTGLTPAEVRFADTGEVLLLADLLALIEKTPRAGTAGDDLLKGSTGDDVLAGLAGNDTIDTGAGNDTILFGPGDGHDVVYGNRSRWGSDGGITLALQDVTPDQVRIESFGYAYGYAGNGATWRVRLLDTGDSLLIADASQVLSKVTFADGTLWSGYAIAGHVKPLLPETTDRELPLITTSGTVVMTAADELIAVSSYGQGYQFVYARDGGHDMIVTGLYQYDTQQNSITLTDIASTEITARLSPSGLMQPDTLMLTFGEQASSVRVRLRSSTIIDGSENVERIKSFVFADGVTLTWAEIMALAVAQSETDVAALTAVVEQGALSEGLTYDRASDSGEHVLPFYATHLNLVGVTAADVSYQRIDADLLIKIAADPATGTGAGWIWAFGSNNFLSVTIDGVEVATGASILAALSQTTGDDVINAALMTNYGNYPVSGGAGDDIIRAENADGLRLHWARGDGDDIMTGASRLAKVTLTDVAPDTFSFVWQDRDLVLVIADSAPGAGDGGSIRFLSADEPLPDFQLVLDDGTVLRGVEVLALAATRQGTDFDDVLRGNFLGSRFVGGKGDDVLIPQLQNDKYVYNSGDGHDVIVETGPNPEVYAPFVRDLGELPQTGPLAPLAGVIDLSFVTPFGVHFVVDDRGVAGLWLPDQAGGVIGRGLPLVTGIGTAGQTLLANTLLFSGGATIEVADLLAQAAFYSRTAFAALSEMADTSGPLLDLSSLSFKDVYFHTSPLEDGTDTQAFINFVVDGTDGHAWQSVMLDDGTGGPPLFAQVAFAGGMVLDIATTLEDALSTWALIPFDRGAGTDGTYLQGEDVLEFSDFLASDLAFSRLGDDLVISIRADAARGIEAGSVRLTNAFTNMPGPTYDPWNFNNTVERITLSDGSVLDLVAIMGNISGAGTPLADTLIGSTGGDTLVGGTGDDRIDGRGGRDLFIYARGDGHDELAAVPAKYSFTAPSRSNAAVLDLRGIDVGDVSARLEPSGIRLVFAESAQGAGDAGSVLLRSADRTTDYNDYAVDYVTFGDGTEWTLSQVHARALAAAATAEDNVILGAYGPDLLHGGAGNDTLIGGYGDDVYVYARGDGIDVVEESQRSTTQPNTLRLTGITPDEVTLRVGSGDNLQILIAARQGSGQDAGRITVIGGLQSASYGIGRIVFDDGTEWAQGTFANLIAAMAVTDGNDRIIGSVGADTLAGGRGDDYLAGDYGNDTYRFARGDGRDQIVDAGGADTIEISGYALAEAQFTRRGQSGTDLVIRFAGTLDTITLLGALGWDSGRAVEQVRFADSGEVLTAAQIAALMTGQQATDGADYVVGTSGSDTLTGAGGADLLSGGEGADTYLFASGDGDDRIADSGTTGTDRLVLDVNPEDLVYALRLAPNSTDLVLRLPGERDRVVLDSALGTGASGVERIEFADGTTWTRDDMRAATLRDVQTAGNDLIVGYDGSDSIDMGAGNDTAQGGAGNDTYVVQRGDGQDRIIDSAGTTDTVDFLDYVSSEVSVTRLFKGSNSVVFRFVTSGDTVTVENALAAGGAGVERYRFSDSVEWSAADVLARLDNLAPEAVRDGYFTVIGDQVLTLTPAQLLRNDYDPDGDRLLLIRVDAGRAGLAEIDGGGNIVFTPAAGVTGPQTISYTISDGRGGFAEGLVDIRIRPVAQVRDDKGFTMAEDGIFTLRSEELLANDADGDRMIVGSVRAAVGGQVSLAQNGQITFVAAPNFNGTAQFTYVANTPEGGVGEGVVQIAVTPVNDAPSAGTDGPFVLDENTSITINAADLLANDRDIEGGRLSVVAVQGNDTVTVTLTGSGQIVATPKAQLFGPVSFTYTVSDPQGASSVGTVRLSVTPVNLTPTPQGDSASMIEDASIFLPLADLLANDSDADGDRLSLVSVSGAVGGSVSLQNNGALFVAAPNFHGQAGFRYTIDDGQGATATAWVSIDVASVNDLPVARDDRYWMQGRDYLRGIEDVPITIHIADLMVNDSDVDDISLVFQTASQAVGGTLSLPGDGTIVFTPDADFWGEATFSYLVTDDEGGVAAARVTMFFENVADAPPVAENDLVTAVEDTPRYIYVSDLLANDTDVDRDPITFLGFGTALGNIHGKLTWAGEGRLLYTPGANETGNSRFFYDITDGISGTSRGFITVQVQPVNDEPVAGDDSGYSTQQGVPLVLRVSDLMSNDSDIENTTLVFDGVAAYSAGVLELWGDQFIVLHLAAGFTGPVMLDYQVTDGQLSDTARVTSAVTPGYNGQITGSDRVDLLIGTTAAETIGGLGGNDTIRAEAGDDLIFGGMGGDLIYAGDGFDTVDFAGSAIGVRASLTTRFGQGGDAQGDEYLAVEAFAGSAFHDTLDGSAGGNLLTGRAGHDSLSGMAGDDSLYGGAGNDVLAGGTGADLMFGGEGDDTADYSGSLTAVAVSLANGTATGGDATGDVLDGIEHLRGSEGNDTLTGDAGANRLTGGRGDDLLTGGDGDDILSGGRGADALFGGAGIDIADYSGSDSGVVVNMANGAAGGGDALGDSFAGIEIVQGSFHADVLIGDGRDNVLRGGVGADTLDGAGGHDVADYATAAQAVAVDLGAGRGTAGEAAGDILTNIEELQGSVWNDTLTGSSGDDSLFGGMGDDLLAGGAGSDSYRFGFGAGADVVVESGTTGIDRIVLNAPVRQNDVSLVREGEDLLIELENPGTFLTDTLRVTGHFAGTQTGIEEIAFEDGPIWDRTALEAIVRLGRFNAVDDLYRFGVEDQPVVLQSGFLTANDATEGAAALELVSVTGLGGATATLDAHGQVTFQGARDQNGDAFFEYSVRDAYGRISTARVEVNLAPVNDAPVAGHDGPFNGVEDQVLTISIASLLANDSDVDGDTLRIKWLDPLIGPDGQPLYAGGEYNLTNGKGQVGATTISFTPRPDHFGFAGFRYVLSDGNGGETYGEVTLNFVGVNDAPRGDDDVTVRLDMVNEISLASLLDNDFDPEGDGFVFGTLLQGFNGSATLSEDGQTIRFVGNRLGDAQFGYTLIDDRGEIGTITVDLTVRPLNDPPNARDDTGLTTFEDRILIIDPAWLLANDSDQNGDALTITALDRFATNGRVEWIAGGLIAFIPRADFNGAAGFDYTISDGRGGFDTGRVNLTIVPQNDAPVLNPDVLAGFEDRVMVIVPGALFGNDYDPDGDVPQIVSVDILGALLPLEADRDATARLDFAADRLDPSVTITARLSDGSDLPAGLVFDTQTLRLSGTLPQGFAGELEVDVTFTLPPAMGGHSLTRSLTVTDLDAAALVDGIALKTGLLLQETDARSLFQAQFDAGLLAVGNGPLGQGEWKIAAPSGRELPDWITFNSETLQIGVDPALVAVGAAPVPLRLSFVPVLPELHTGWRSTASGNFGLDVMIDPVTGLDAGIAVMLAEQAFFRVQGLIALPADSLSPQVTLANGAPLPTWLTFDAQTLKFSGTPPEGDYVGSLQVRLDLGIFDLVTEVLIDPAFRAQSLSGFVVSIVDGQVRIVAPTDFDGTYAFAYTARDEIGALSRPPGIGVVNLTPTREKPDATPDLIRVDSTGSVTIAVRDLLANDSDRDGDPVWITGFGAVSGGTLVVTDGQLVVTAAEAGLAPVAGAIWGATLADGSPLPDWVAVDASTGTVSYTVPLHYRGALDIALTRSADATTDTVILTRALNGNELATLIYTLPASYLPSATVSYTVTDGAPTIDEGAVQTSVTFLANTAPEAEDETFNAVEDTALLLGASQLLVNDTDADGDALIVTSVQGALNGSVSLADGVITFVPTANFDGTAGFFYTVSDGRGGTDSAEVRLAVASTNRAPVAGLDTLTGTEDTPIIVSLAQLMANDSDADGDMLTFLGFDDASGLETFLMPDGRWQIMPDVNANGPLTLTYRIGDGRATRTGTVEIDLAAVNDAPVLRPDPVAQGIEDRPLQIDLLALLANDYDPEGDAFSVVEVYDPDNGTVSRSGNIVTFTPRADYTGNAGFRYVVEDAHGAQVTGYALIQVQPVVDPAFAVSDRFGMVEDGTLLIDPAALLANDTDPDGGTLTFLGLSGLGVSLNANGTYTYRPAENMNGAVSLSYQITNASDIRVTGIVTIDIAPIPDAPVARRDTVTVVEDVPYLLDPALLLANDSDVDFNAFALSSVTAGTGLTVSLTPSGQISILTNTNRIAPATFTYAATDTTGLSANATVTVNITPVNDAPVLAAPLSDRNAFEETAFSIALQTYLVSDPDGDALTYRLTRADGSPLPGWISFNPLTQTISGTPPLNFFGDVMLRLVVTDGEFTVTDDFALRVANTPDNVVLLRPLADVSTAAGGARITVGTAFSFAADLSAFADPDGTPLAFAAQLASGAALPDWLSFNGTAFIGTPPSGSAGTLDIRLLARDGASSVSDVFTLTILDSAPVPYDQTITGGNAGGNLNGTAGRDRITGGTGADVIFDGAGNDDVFGGGGADTFMAGPGADRYDGGAGVDRIDYSGSTIGLTINMVNSALSTGIAKGDSFVSVEWLYATEFDDLLVTNGTSRIYALGGDDFIRDSQGTQSIWGGAGRDWFQFVAGDSIQDRIMDFQIGQDVIDLSLWGATNFDQLTITSDATGVIIGYRSESLLLDRGAASLVSQLNGSSFNFAEVVTVDPGRWAGATVDGTAGHDTIDGAYRDVDGQGISGGNQTIAGGAGNDIIFDGGGNDIVYGGDGDDLFHAGEGNDVFDGGAGRDTLSYAYAQSGILLDMDDPANNAGAAAGDRFISIDWVNGSDHSDIILAAGVSRIYARAGDDYIRDGAGTQVIFGGAGRDTFAFVAGDGQIERVMDFKIGEDLLDLRAWGVSSFEELEFELKPGGEDLVIRYGSEAVQLDKYGSAQLALLTAASFLFAAPAAFTTAPPTPEMPETLQPLPTASMPQPGGTDAQSALSATLSLAASAGDSLIFTNPTQPAAMTFSSGATRTSYIAGDELGTGQVAEVASASDDGIGGALVDPETTMTAFLSPTQLAAMDGNQMSFY